MFAIIAENLATILISTVLLAVIIWISVSLIKKKRSGKAVGCGCDGCQCASACHNKR